MDISISSWSKVFHIFIIMPSTDCSLNQPKKPELFRPSILNQLTLKSIQTKIVFLNVQCPTFEQPLGATYNVYLQVYR